MSTLSQRGAAAASPPSSGQVRRRVWQAGGGGGGQGAEDKEVHQAGQEEGHGVKDEVGQKKRKTLFLFMNAIF